MESSEYLNRPLVEVCVGSVADVLAAAEAGADRLELCSATELGGLTPSAGLLEQVLSATRLPVVAMIRPRAGGFAYDRHDFATALRDAELAIEQGVAGIVFGCLDRAGSIDVARCRELFAMAGAQETIFHRAFEFVPDPLKASDQLVELGVTRLLTSGQQGSAREGAELICTIAHRTAGVLQVMPGGRIRPADVAEIIRRTGCTQIHVGASRLENDDSLTGNRIVRLDSATTDMPGCHRVVQQSFVADIVNAANRLVGVSPTA